MNFQKPITYLCLAAFKILLAHAAFSKNSQIKTLMDTAEDAGTKNPFSSQDNFVSLAKSTPHTRKPSQAEHNINLLSENEDITPHSLNNKRQFKEAFERRDPKTKILSDAGTQYNFASAPKGLELDYHDYYPQNNLLWLNNLALMHQPLYLDTLTRIDSNGAAESQVGHYLGESSITAKLPFQSLIEREPVAGQAGKINSSLVKNIRLLQQGEARKLQGEKQNSDEVFGNPHLFHFDHKNKVSQNSTTGKLQKKN
ncbi:hypothetical protein BY996DRAFT_8686180 [Phakopsora pachyrhizi]|nr:hypothetical protein BY996DRAFT_8686180 [Phakopsora pachyrhizi]